MFTIDLTSRTPIFEQIYNKIVELVITGVFSENDQLPSVRNMAKETGVNPNTVAKAYQELERRGIIYSVPGRGSFISGKETSAIQEAMMSEFDKAAISAMKRGISTGTLKERIDTLYNKIGGEKSQ